MANTNLRIMSYNCRGHSPQRLDYIDRLMKACDILLIQEHWYFHKDMDAIPAHLGNVYFTGVSGMDHNELLIGRPYGGCAICVKTSVKCKFVSIPSKSKRMCACILQFSSTLNLLLFNVYMPCDGTNQNVFDDVLDEIKIIISLHNECDHYIIGGDFNTDYTRVQSPHVVSLRQFEIDLCLKECLYHDCACVDYTYSNDITGARSTIDHFLVTKNLFSNIVRYAPMHEGDNLSDHSPVEMQLSLNIPRKLNVLSRATSAKRSWHRASEENVMNYKLKLRALLSRITVPYDALRRNVSVSEYDATMDAIRVYHDSIVQACIDAATATIPRVKKKRKAGWGQHCEPQRKQAILWNNIWKQSGSPQTGWVHAIRQSTRNAYRRASRWVTRNQEKLQAEKMTESLHRGQQRNFWTEVQRMKRSHNPDIPEVDGVTGDDGIRSIFCAKYKDLYNSVAYDENEMEELIRELDARTPACREEGGCYDDHNVAVSHVRKAINKLKQSKSDACESLSTDNFKNACYELSIHISLLLQMIMHHSTAPQTMLTSTLIPIPKNLKKSLSDSNNFRSIALSSLISKILDNIILLKHSATLNSSNLQFGFKRHHSTTQCTFALQEIVQHYTQRGSTVPITLLDASRAFDRVNFIKLFQLLLERRMCPLTSRLLLTMYTTQELNVRWNDAKSSNFKCSNGVKQGAVLSPILFCVYIDELLCRLKKSEVGCHIGHHYAGALGYADDVALIAPSLGAMRRMLLICQDFATEYHVTFNSAKSVSIIIGPENCTDLIMNNEVVPRSEMAVHLGHFVGKAFNEANIRKAKSAFCLRINGLLAKFMHCSFHTIQLLFSSYCTSYYGCPLWDFNALSGFPAFWRKCIRRLLRLPYRTHSRFIAPLFNKPDLLTQLRLRFAKFLSSCYNSTNSLVSVCAKLTFQSHSVVANNLRDIMSHLNLDHNALGPLLSANTLANSLNRKINRDMLQNPIDSSICHSIIEMIKIRKGELFSPLSIPEIEELLFTICVE